MDHKSFIKLFLAVWEKARTSSSSSSSVRRQFVAVTSFVAQDHIPLSYRSRKIREQDQRGHIACHLDLISSGLLLENESRNVRRRTGPKQNDHDLAIKPETYWRRYVALIVYISRYHFTAINK